MHEQSETVQRPDGSWANVYGRKTRQAGQMLPRKYSYESDSYPDSASAVEAAKRRSKDEGRQQYDPAGPFPGYARGGPIGLPGAQASFGSMKPIIELIFKDLLAKAPMQVKRAERVK